MATVIDDIVGAVFKILKKPPKPVKIPKNKFLKPNVSFAPYRIFNIGNNKPINLNKYVNILENVLGKKAKKKYLTMQKGDLKYTHANLKNLMDWINFKPRTNLKNGIKAFVEWYDNYYGLYSK